ncbi:MAG TPA: transporter [Acetobacteraceae bacterium]|nr:transporter [Acetobacteraceae bacterium]
MPNFRSLKKTCAAVLACSVIGAGMLLAGTGAVQAQEIEPNEFLPLPAGSNLALGYYIYGHDTEFTVHNGPTIKNNTGLEVNVGVARYIHFFDVAGHPAGVQVLQPFGSLSGAQVGGRSLGSAAGAQNTILSAFIWPYVDYKSKTYVNVTGFLYPPDGTYDKDSAINVGDGRWRGDLLLGLDKAFGKHLSTTAAFDVMFYGDNTNAFNPGLFPGNVTLSQDNTYRGQVWLNWNFNRAMQAAIGWEGFFGGVQRDDGFLNGQATEEQRIRATFSSFVSPTTQVLLELNHDFSSSGTFKQDFGATLRLLYAF